jgi:hypothetical protein
VTGPITGAALAAVTAAIECEQLATFGYGTLGPRLSIATQADLARDCEQAHRKLAESALPLAAGAPSQASPPADSYQLPMIAVDEPTAVRLAIELEQACASAWRAVLAQLTQLSNPSSSWPTAVGALTDSAVRAVKWRRANDPQSASVAFPGI